tara:strand:+ start:3632 stop:4309 length:678 start_codon:yes stop_codon:yes gene_type:complete
MEKQLIYGTYKLPKSIEEFGKILEKLLATGIKTIDTAYCYNHGLSEEWIGKSKNKDFIISSKVGKYYDDTGKLCVSLNKKDVVNQILESLNRLNMQKLPILFLHNYEERRKIPEIRDLIKEIKEKNLAEKIGLSNFHLNITQELIKENLVDLVQIKIGDNIKNEVKYYNEKGVEVWLYRPFLRGNLLENNHPREIVAKLLKEYPNVKIIFGASKIDQLSWLDKNG